MSSIREPVSSHLHGNSEVGKKSYTGNVELEVFASTLPLYIEVLRLEIISWFYVLASQSIPLWTTFY